MSFQDKLKFSGNVPMDVFAARLKTVTTLDELNAIKLQAESKKRNIDMIQKVFWRFVFALTTALGAAGFVSLQHFIKAHPDKGPALIGTFIILAIAYLAFMAGFIFLIQHTKNGIYNRYVLITEAIDRFSQQSTSYNTTRKRRIRKGINHGK